MSRLDAEHSKISISERITDEWIFIETCKFFFPSSHDEKFEGVQWQGHMMTCQKGYTHIMMHASPIFHFKRAMQFQIATEFEAAFLDGFPRALVIDLRKKTKLGK